MGATPKSGSRTLGKKAFASISAVEGLRLGKDSRARLKSLSASGLSAKEKREVVIAAYKVNSARGAKSRV
jgi:hypothetical protein